MSAIERAGTVLGIDVGYSRTRKTTCFALLAWNEAGVSLRLTKAGRGPRERRWAMAQAVGDCRLPLTIAVDGPLTRDLRPWKEYRSCEALLSGGIMQKRGKPGQTNSPTGNKLHVHALLLSRLSLRLAREGSCLVKEAAHEHAIHERAIVEAFPNSFLGALLPESAIPPLKRNASDRFWEVLAREDRLEALIGELLPGHKAEPGLLTTSDHDERAAIVCALTALGVRVGRYVAVGDRNAGFIILPPLEAWGRSPRGLPWLWEHLESAIDKKRETFPTAVAEAIGSAGHRL